MEYLREKNQYRRIHIQVKIKNISQSQCVVMMDFICRIISCLISFLPFKFVNDLVMFLYKIYCRRQHRSVQESLNYIVRKQGFYLETYEVQTKDGYILIVHRIKRKNLEKSQENLYYRS